jgi:hypothetical protein
MHTQFWLESLQGGDHLGRLKCRWEDDIKMDLREISLEDVDWIYLVQDRDCLL